MSIDTSRQAYVLRVTRQPVPRVIASARTSRLLLRAVHRLLPSACDFRLLRIANPAGSSFSCLASTPQFSWESTLPCTLAVEEAAQSTSVTYLDPKNGRPTMIAPRMLAWYYAMGYQVRRQATDTSPTATGAVRGLHDIPTLGSPVDMPLDSNAIVSSRKSERRSQHRRGSRHRSWYWFASTSVG